MTTPPLKTFFIKKSPITYWFVWKHARNYRPAVSVSVRIMAIHQPAPNLWSKTLDCFSNQEYCWFAWYSNRIDLDSGLNSSSWSKRKFGTCLTHCQDSRIYRKSLHQRIPNLSSVIARGKESSGLLRNKVCFFLSLKLTR
jgi:hypothetical protein